MSLGGPFGKGIGLDDTLAIHRLQFAFTVTFHYLFPQLTMGLALLIVILKTVALRTDDDHYNRAARFWARIFGINFVLGVVTGIPMEFQFGTNWAQLVPNWNSIGMPVTTPRTKLIPKIRAQKRAARL